MCSSCTLRLPQVWAGRSSVQGLGISHSWRLGRSQFPELTDVTPQSALLRRHWLLLTPLLAMLGCILSCRGFGGEVMVGQERWC